jgi:hypothetical protein
MFNLIKYLKYKKKNMPFQIGSGKNDDANINSESSSNPSGSSNSSNSSNSSISSISSNSSSSNNDDVPNIKIVSLGLSDEEKDNIKKIKIEKVNHTEFVYQKDNIYEKVLKYINDIGDNDKISENVSRSIQKIIENVIKHEKEESAIVWIRATPYHKDDLKFRWHRDGFHLKKLDVKKPAYKFVTTLRGASTPVVVDKNAIEKFNILDENKKEFENCFWTFIGKNKINPMDVIKDVSNISRKILDPALVSAIGDDYIQAKTLDEGVYFLLTKDASLLPRERIDSTDYGTIHSEPEIQEDRLFLGILPGPVDKCREWIESIKK